MYIFAMKKLFLLLFAFCLSGYGRANETDFDLHAADRHEINAGWQFRQQNFGAWRAATVPGTVHTDLLANKAIEDPFYRTNERDQQWIDKVNWEYRTAFDAPYIAGRDSVALVFDGLDTYAEITLNGRRILSADNMFRTWRVNVTGLLRAKGNELHILFRSPIIIGLEKFTAWGMPIQANNDNAEMGGLGPDNKVSVFTRKAGYHFGWDWGPRFVTCGIWRPVAVECWDEARLADVYVRTVSIVSAGSAVSAGAKTADVAVGLDVSASAAANYDMEISLDGQSAQKFSAALTAGDNAISETLTVKNPRLWWPNGAGEQNLYDVKVTLSRGGKLLDTRQTKLGIRTIKLVQTDDKDGRGRSFGFEVNGRMLFCKGSNYIPSDMFLPRVDSARLEHTVKSAADANMNMLRVWGGGTYENNIFYELCDKYGIMVWQDLMFACSTYPGGAEFVDNIRREIEDNVVRLRNHPCIALWCGNNEIEVALQPWNDKAEGWRWRKLYTPKQYKELVSIYDTIFHQVIPAVMAAKDPQRPYWPSSPSPGWKISVPDPLRYGDTHFWGVWHQKLPFSEFDRQVPRFMTEYGFQSFPELATVKTYAEPRDWDIESEVMSAHQRSGIGNLRIRQYMEEDYRLPPTFEGMLYLSQVLQAEGIKRGIEAHRRNMPWCMGSLYWQINDVWPVASWSSIDSEGRWKALHYFAKKAFENVIVAPYLHGDTLRGLGDMLDLYVISDLPVKVDGTMEVALLDFSGKTLGVKSFKAAVAANASTLVASLRTADLLGSADPRKVVAVCTLSGKTADGKNVAFTTLRYFDRVKNLDLPEAKPTFEVRKSDAHTAVITVSSDLLAKNVILTYKGVAGIFSDNYFDVLPGRKVEVTLPTDDTAEAVRSDITLRSLMDFYKQ